MDDLTPKEHSAINEPVAVQHDNTGKKYSCTFCTESYAHATTLHKHIRTKHAHQIFMCRACGANNFHTRASLERHRECHHSLMEECDQCGTLFKFRKNLNAHMKRVHMNHTPYACSECERSFASRWELKRHHMQVHTEEKPYRCCFCSKRFKLAQMLNNHIRKHGHRERQACYCCHKLFKCRRSLRRHEKTHEADS